jgi:hypothetical protein
MYTILGIIGGLLILFGFYRISFGGWTGKSFWYELDNLIGAILLLTYQLHARVYVSVVLNVIYAIVALRGVMSYGERRRKNRRRHR